MTGDRRESGKGAEVRAGGRQAKMVDKARVGTQVVGHRIQVIQGKTSSTWKLESWSDNPDFTEHVYI